MKQCSVAVQATPVTTRLTPGREAAEPNGQGDARPDSDPSHAYARSLRQRCTDTQTDTARKVKSCHPGICWQGKVPGFQHASWQILCSFSSNLEQPAALASSSHVYVYGINDCAACRAPGTQGAWKSKC